MAISLEQRKKLGLPQADGAEHQVERAPPTLQQLEEGQEIAPEVAERLQPMMGNHAVAALLARTASTTQTATGTADFELAEDLAQSSDEEYAGGELQLPDVQMGGGDGTGDNRVGGESMPWELSHLFGGDDDPKPKPKRRNRRQGAPSQETPPDEADDYFDDDEILPTEHAEHIDRTMGATPPMRQEYRAGDARYRAIEAGLASPHAVGRRSLVPESMVDRTDHLDPIGRATAIARFLSHAASQPSTRALARCTAIPVSALLPAKSGHAGAAARLASLTLCSEALEGGGTPTDNAIALALSHDAWPTAITAARALAKTGQVIALNIVEASGEQVGKQEGSPRLYTQLEALTAVRLGRHALDEILPTLHLPIVPRIHFPNLPQPSLDPQIAAIDAVILELTGGKSPSDLPPERRLDAERIAPVLHAATRLVNAMGQAQVELAAATIALLRIRPHSPFRATLTHADRALRQLARSIVRSGDQLHKATNATISETGDLHDRTVTELRETALAFKSLRVWFLSAIAEGLYR